MKRNFLKTTLLLISIVLGVNSFAKSEIIPAKGKFDSRFLIVIDKESFAAAREEVLDYKSVLEKEGLGAVILIGEWSNPKILRGEIKDLFNKKPVLEGAVFVGKVPVVRVQNFQHSTTAFKMDEIKYPMEESSVTSDRYYDDLDLEFEFIKQDSKDPNQFYYRLSESSPQVIKSDFYSARMMPPSDMGIEPVVLLKRYLKKVVAAHNEKNPLDKLVIFNGHGYNSDCLTAWQNEQFVIKEQIPLAFTTSKGNGFYNFRQDPQMKFKLFEKMQQPETDLFIFHEHGGEDTQYINGDYPAPNFLEVTTPEINYSTAGARTGPMTILARSLRNTYRRYKGARALTFKEELIKEYGFTEEFFDQKRLDSLRISDSTFAADINIVLSDLTKIKMQPKFSIFDACYNASFHKAGYVAGYHVFGNGNTIVAQGNTVNVLQDKWSLELLGMLAEGARVGFWQKEFQYLESHLIGDPTYHFASEGTKRFNANLAAKVKETKLWEEYLNSANPNLQAIALKQLSKNPSKDFSSRLLQVFKESKFYSVRLEALKRLLDIGDANMVEAIRLGLDDQYELIRRVAARFAGYSGDPVLVAPLVNTILFSNESQRVQYSAQGSLLMFEPEVVIHELDKQISSSNLMDKEKVKNDLTSYVTREFKSQERSLKTILDTGVKPETRISAIRGLRNNNNHKQVAKLLSVLKNVEDDSEVRTFLAEALGWFTLSINRDDIFVALNEVYANPNTDEKLKGEVLQSINRLNK